MIIYIILKFRVRRKRNGSRRYLYTTTTVQRKRTLLTDLRVKKKMFSVNATLLLRCKYCFLNGIDCHPDSPGRLYYYNILYCAYNIQRTCETTKVSYYYYYLNDSRKPTFVQVVVRFHTNNNNIIFFYSVAKTISLLLL